MMTLLYSYTTFVTLFCPHHILLTLTTALQFPLYTLMVFDEWHQGIPTAWVLTSRCAKADLTPWMVSLKARMKKYCPEWNPSAFIVDCAQGEINALTYILNPTHALDLYVYLIFLFLCFFFHFKRVRPANVVPFIS